MKRQNLIWKLARRIFSRDFKSGELSIVLVSVILATATVTSISLFTSRIENSIIDEASEFLAADAKVSGAHPVPTEWKDRANSFSLATSHFIEFRAMAFAGEEMLLTQVKAVDQRYPLKGQLKIAREAYTEDMPTTQGPLPGKAWIALRVMQSLGINVGDKLSIGEAEFTVEYLVTKEPDNSQSFFGVSPRVMIHIDDVEKTQAVQLGSRVNYSWLLAGDKATLAKFKDTIFTEEQKHHRWIDVTNGNRSIATALERANSFLLLAGCLSVLLAGVATALAARRYAARQQTQVALLKTFGQTPKHIVQLYSFNLSFIAVTGILLGGLLGWLLHFGIVFILGDLIPTNLANATPYAYFIGVVSACIALMAFAAPPLFALRNVSPVAILRNDNTPNIKAITSALIGFVAMLALVLLYSRDILLTGLISFAIIICSASVGLLSALMIRFVHPLGKRFGKAWRLGLANLQRHRQMNTPQIMVFAILLFLLFVMTNVRGSLINQWQNQIPPETPNHFVFNIFPDEAPAIKSFLQDNNIAHNPFYPMVRGRIIEADNQRVEEILKETKSNHNYERELNLTWSNTLGDDNKIVQGQWWDKLDLSADKHYVSVEEGFAQGIKVEVGDTITLSVAGTPIEAHVVSLRSVQWDSMNPNFFIIFHKPILDGIGANWLTSFYLSPENKRVLNTLAKDFPTVSLIEIDQTIAQVRSIVGNISLAVEFILVLILVSGFLVLISSIQATLDVRLQESAIVRTLGAQRSLIRNILLIEFAGLGFMAGLLAVVGNEVCLYFLQTKVFDLQYQAQIWTWILGPIFSTSVIALVGWLSTRRVVNTSPLQVLRQLD